VRSRNTGTRFAIGGAILLILGALLWIAQRLGLGTLERNDQIASVISMFAGLASLAVAIIALRQKPIQQVGDEEDQRSRAAETLAEAVQAQWEEEARVRTLRRPTPLRLHWLATDRPVTAPAATIVGDIVGGGRVTRVRFHGHLEEIGLKFLALPHRRLVILGEPGAGKTALAMLLTLDLLARRRPGDPVPMLLSISSWNPTREHLHVWIARRLMEDYPALGSLSAYGPAVAAQLVTSGRILPILDGLDELPAGLRGIAIGDLDRAHADRPLVVTCRSEEFQEAVSTGGEILTAAAVVEIQPVVVDEVIEFLRATIPATDTRWDDVFDNLRTDPNGGLASALSSPLMATLARTIFAGSGREPSTLLAIAGASDQAAIERYLLRNFVPAVYEDRPAAPGLRTSLQRERWRSESASRYLTFLAAHLHRRNTRDLAWWEIAQSIPRGMFPLLFGLELGLVVGLVFGVGAGVLAGVVFGLVFGLVAGLMAALAAGFAVRIGKEPSPERLHIQIRGRLRELTRILPRSFRRELRVGLVVGLVFGVGAGVLAGVVFGLVFGLVAGLVAALGAGLLLIFMVGLMMGITEWLSSPADDTLAVTPQSVLTSDRAVTVIRGLVILVISGSILGLPIRLTGGNGLAEGLAFGLWAGVLGGIVGTAWGSFVMARAFLAVRGRLPLRLMSFLNDAYNRGVLRMNGAAYQFRHARLQDYLADQLSQAAADSEPCRRDARS
jgi:hypothetical protein